MGIPNRAGDYAGFYVARFTTGNLAAALGVDAPVLAIRNGPTTNTKKVYITRIDLDFDCGTAFTAAQQFGIYMQRFTAANLTGGTTITPMKVRSADPASACLNGGTEGGDVRCSTTAALSAAGVSFDGASGVPIMGWTDPTSGKKTAGRGYQGDLFPESQPIELLAGDGLAIRNLVVWPAAGTGVLTGAIYWFERS